MTQAPCRALGNMSLSRGGTDNCHIHDHRPGECDTEKALQYNDLGRFQAGGKS
jgi:hypothetical protein